MTRGERRPVWSSTVKDSELERVLSYLLKPTCRTSHSGTFSEKICPQTSLSVASNFLCVKGLIPDKGIRDSFVTQCLLQHAVLYFLNTVPLKGYV